MCSWPTCRPTCTPADHRRGHQHRAEPGRQGAHHPERHRTGIAMGVREPVAILSAVEISHQSAVRPHPSPRHAHPPTTRARPVRLPCRQPTPPATIIPRSTRIPRSPRMFRLALARPCRPRPHQTPNRPAYARSATRLCHPSSTLARPASPAPLPHDSAVARRHAARLSGQVEASAPNH